MPSLQGFPFGEDVVVQEAATGQVWLLEGSQAEAWRKAAGKVPPAAGPAPSFPAPLAPAPVGTPALALTVAQGGPAVAVRCWDERLGRTFAGALAPLVRNDLAPVRTIDLYPTPEGPVVAVDGRLAHQPGSAGLGRWLALRQLAVELFPARRWLALLHAASVAMPFGAVVLAAASGSGKTTLAGALLAAGGILLADDITPLEADSLAAWPFPLAMSVKEGSWPLFTRMHPSFAAVPPVRIGASRVRYFQPDHPLAFPAPHRVAMLVAPRYRQGASPALTRLSPADLLRHLVATGTWPPSDPAGLQQMLAWLRDLPAFLLTYGELADAVRLIQEQGGRTS